MCGIFGIVNKDLSSVLREEVLQMSQILCKRGPDGEGIFINSNIGIGHRRLSIIDLQSGKQPMFDYLNRVVISFNGEIYNYKELRQDLENKNYIFQTTSDTEVIINAYIEYGIDSMLNMLDGMFAFSLYDTRDKSFYLARDRFGEKPLYYKNEDNKFTFASELKALKIEAGNIINKTALNLFLNLSYIPAPYTIYSGIYKLKASTYLRITDGSVSIKQYYDFTNHIVPNNISFDQAKEELKDMLISSIKSRMVSDVPVGAFLSGGIDSSIVCTVMSQFVDGPLKTYSIGFKESDYDETERAELIAERIKSDHSKFVLDFNSALTVLDDVLDYYDEPFGDPSAIPSFYVAKLARKDVKLVLTGDGADEIFAGYNKYLADYYVNKLKLYPELLLRITQGCIKLIPFNHYTSILLRKIDKVLANRELSSFDLYYNLLCVGMTDDCRERILNSDYYTDVKILIKDLCFENIENINLRSQQIGDIKLVLEGDMLPKVDRVCMMNSLENRSPFINHKIIEYVLSLPDSYRITGKSKKIILKEAFRDLLPLKTLQYSKKGFGVPIDYWLRNDLNSEFSDLIAEDFILRQGIFNYNVLKGIQKEHVSGKKNMNRVLWNIYVFQKWYNKYYLS